jgi:hypothetical protein
MSDDHHRPQPGTAEPARLRKAACGIRFEEDELQEGIDFSAACQLKPEANETPADSETGPGKHR